MRKRLMLIRAANWELSFLYQFRRFQNVNLWCFFQKLFARKRGLVYLTFYMQMNDCKISFTCYERNDVSTP